MPTGLIFFSILYESNSPGQIISFMKDLEPILNVLYNYKSGFVLSEDELRLLRDWLAESSDHENLFEELNNKNGMQFIMGSTERNLREKIQLRLIEIEESAGTL
jgi:hypothetical protein